VAYALWSPRTQESSRFFGGFCWFWREHERHIRPEMSVQATKVHPHLRKSCARKKFKLMQKVVECVIWMFVEYGELCKVVGELM
jgi:hypothetical protein